MKQNRVPKNEYIIQPKGKTNPYKHDVIYSDLGQWKYPGQVTRIPSNQITMQGVPYPVQGIDDTGYSQMMYPGSDYQFPGNYVTEYPMAMYGGDPSLNNIESHYPFGGQNTKTHTHMAQGGWLDTYDKGGNKKYIAAAETTGLNKPALPVPSLDTLRREKVARESRPWNEWSEEEKEYYIMHPLDHPTREQDSIWGERAEEWSRAKAKKEMREDFVRKSTKAALLDNPFWNTAVSFTPQGAITSMIKGAFNVTPDIYKSVKDPSLANYANVASDVLSMAHAGTLSDKLPKFVGKIANIKNKGFNFPLTNSRINVGDLKKSHGVLKKFEPTEKEKVGSVHYYDEGGTGPVDNKSNPSTLKSENVSEEKKYDTLYKYLEEKRRVEDVRNKAAEIAAKKANSKNQSTRTDLSYIKTGAYYCNTHTGECFQDAGATTPEGKKIPVIPGNLQWDSKMKDLGFEWTDTPQPGDVAREQLYRTTDYQGNPLSPGWYTSHSGVVTKAGEDPNEIMIGNAPGGARNKYVNQPVNQMTGGRDNKTVHMKYQRYVGNLPSMQNEYDKIMHELNSEGVPSIPLTRIENNIEEPDIIIPTQPALDYGGFLYNEYKRGGQKGLKKYTSKNIATSVNDIMLRNETLFGPAGKKRYKPGLKYKSGGGWLDNLH